MIVKKNVSQQLTKFYSENDFLLISKYVFMKFLQYRWAISFYYRLTYRTHRSAPTFEVVISQ